MIMTDLVYDEIRSELASHRPERGGALYGPKGYPAVTHFEYDAEGETSAMSYVPSSRLVANVVRVERETGLQFKGIVHSHPPGLLRPSSGDAKTVQTYFRLNPHVSAMALPIVQELTVDAVGDSPRFLHWYRAERRKPARRRHLFEEDDAGDVAILDEAMHVLPLHAHVTKLLELLAAEGLHLRCEPKVQHLKLRHAELLGLIAQDDFGHEFMYFVSLDYPVMTPVVLYQQDKTTCNLPILWNGIEAAEESLAAIARSLCNEWRPSSSQPSDLLSAYSST
jgi:proteasome lid subunit RPN8/RPN11